MRCGLTEYAAEVCFYPARFVIFVNFLNRRWPFLEHSMVAGGEFESAYAET